MNKILTKWYWWWGWDATRLERWLEAMASQGWRLVSVDTGGIRFRFQSAEPENMAFGVDYHSRIDGSYLDLVTADGWSLVWTGAGGWYLWRREYAGTRPELFTDADSLIQRNDRLTRLLGPLFIVILVVLGILLVNRQRVDTTLIILYLFLAAFYSYIFFQIQRHNRQLKDGLPD